MAKLSDIFGRKGIPAGADRLTGRPRNGNGNDHISIESPSDVGSRMGEENEVLRNLLTDTGRKIGELDDLKAAFDKLVAPFNSTLRALEQEKSQIVEPVGHAGGGAHGLRDPAHRILSDREKGDRDRSRGGETARRSGTRARIEPRLESARLELTDDLQRASRADHRARAPVRAGNHASAAAERSPPHRCRTNRHRRKTQHRARRRARRARAKSWRCWKTRSVRCKSRSIRRSTSPPA